jgi:hypothetical protein
MNTPTSAANVPHRPTSHNSARAARLTVTGAASRFGRATRLTVTGNASHAVRLLAALTICAATLAQPLAAAGAPLPQSATPTAVATPTVPGTAGATPTVTTAAGATPTVATPTGTAPAATTPAGATPAAIPTTAATRAAAPQAPPASVTIPPGPKVLIDEHFVDNRNQWHPRGTRGAREHYAITIDGGLHLRSDPENPFPDGDVPGYLFDLPEAQDAVSNLVAEVELTLLDGAADEGYGLTVFSPEDRYIFDLLITGDRRVALWFNDRERYRPLVNWQSQGLVLQAGYSNRLRLAIQNGVLAAHINGFQVARFDQIMPKGEWVVALRSQPSLHVLASEFMIREARPADVAPERFELIYDNPTSHALSWFQMFPLTRTLTYGQEGYVLDATANQQGPLLVSATNTTGESAPVVTSATIRTAGGDPTAAYGIAVRAEGNSTGIRLLIKPTGELALIRITPQGEQAVTAWHVSGAVRQGDELNTLKLISTTNKVVAVVNDVVVGTVEGLPPPAGQFQLVAHPGARPAVKRFAAWTPWGPDLAALPT